MQGPAPVTATRERTTRDTGSGSASALAEVMARLQLEGDFPAASRSIGTVNRIAEGAETENSAMLANAVLEDVALTHKILRVVNSATFRLQGGAVSTVSRAVMILGFDTIRNLAVALLLIDNLQDRAQADALRETFVRALLAGLMARHLAPAAGVRQSEEAFVCALFHDLGRMVALLHLPTDAEAVRTLMADEGLSEPAAARRVLGITYDVLGVEVARHWGFPEAITRSQRRFGPAPVYHVGTAADRVHLLTALSHALAETVAEHPPRERAAQVKALLERYGHGLGLTEPALHAALDDALARIHECAATFDLQLNRTALSRQIRTWTGLDDAAVRPHTSTATGLPNGLPDTVVPPPPGAVRCPDHAVAVLTAGIQDVSNALTGDYRLSDLLKMILETMYQSLGPQRVLLAVRDVQADALQGRFGFGPDVQALAGRFRVPMETGADVFRLVLNRGVDLLVTDADAPEIRDRIPPWFRAATKARTFALFPIIVKDRPMALIYAEHERPGDLVIPERELSLMRTLRNQAVLAIRQAA
jgi:HD-like signal output (HDOD) protein